MEVKSLTYLMLKEENICPSSRRYERKLWSHKGKTLQWRNVFVVTIAGAELTVICSLLHYCTTKILKQHCHWLLLRYWSGLICCELSPDIFFFLIAAHSYVNWYTVHFKQLYSLSCLTHWYIWCKWTQAEHNAKQSHGHVNLVLTSGLHKTHN